MGQACVGHGVGWATWGDAVCVCVCARMYVAHGC